MKGGIDKDFYCTGDHYYQDEGCRLSGTKDCIESCSERCRKHPTPEQFKEEYGEDYPDDGAVYCRLVGGVSGWMIVARKNANHMQSHSSSQLLAVCACTPFGKPDEDWRPHDKPPAG
jgi:hypothetical protein